MLRSNVYDMMLTLGLIVVNGTSLLQVVVFSSIGHLYAAMLVRSLFTVHGFAQVPTVDLKKIGDNK